VIGHSLHDDHLVAALADATDHARVAICAYAPDADPNEVSNEARDEISSQVPHALIVPSEFGPRPDFDQSALQTWLEA